MLVRLASTIWLHVLDVQRRNVLQSLAVLARSRLSHGSLVRRVGEEQELYVVYTTYHPYSRGVVTVSQDVDDAVSGQHGV